MTPAGRPDTREEDAIRAKGEEFEAAWNRHDTHTLAMQFAEDGDLINPFGRAAKSRSEIEALLKEEHSGRLRNSHMSQTLERVRLLAPDVALLDLNYQLTGMRDPSGKEVAPRGHITVVLKKQGAEWQIVASRPMVPLTQPA